MLFIVGQSKASANVDVKLLF